MFSENWHLVSQSKLTLLPKVRIQYQIYRGEPWYLLQDPFNNKYFRIRPEAYEFVSRLSSSASVEQVWLECIELFPDTAPDQEEVVQLLSQLHHANLLHFSHVPDSERIAARFKQQMQQATKAKWAGFLFIRIPIWDPEQWLRRIQPFINLLFSWPMMLIWCLSILGASKLVLENWTALSEQAQGVLAPDNFFLLIIVMAVLKGIHELGHAMMVKRFGGQVHTMGIMLLIFTPLPYMDATDSWRFKNRWHRVLVGGAGMLTELFCAAIAAVVWANTGAGLVNSLAFNVMLIGSISSLIFNGNPLLRFDAYYMLSDALDIPNLYQKSRQQLTYLIEKYVFISNQLEHVAHTTKEGIWLATYGVLSILYRLFVMVAILLFVADQWLILGLVLLLMSTYMWLFKPMKNLFKFLNTAARISQCRGRAKLISYGTLLSVLAFLLFVPVDNSLRAPALIESSAYTPVFAPSSGTLVASFAQSGERIEKGQSLVRLESRDLTLTIESVKAQIAESSALLTASRQRAIADMAPIQEQIKALQKRLVVLETRQRDLEVKAPVAGIWIAPDLNVLNQSWFAMKEQLGTLVEVDEFSMSAVVSQKQAAEMFARDALSGTLKIPGQAQNTLSLSSLELIPYEQTRLPSAALGWQGGGSIETCHDCNDPLQAIEPFFLVQGRIDPSDQVTLYHGVTGVVRLDNDPQPLALQAYQSINQLLQKRYRL